MTHKFALLIGTAVFSTVAFAGTKAYKVEFPQAVQAGNAQLAPGDYKVVVDGTNAIFTDSKTKKSVTVPVKVDSANHKFDSNMLDEVGQGSGVRLKSISLGGSKTTIEFAQ